MLPFAATLLVVSAAVAGGGPPQLDVWFGPKLDSKAALPGSKCTSWCVPCCSHGPSVVRPDLWSNLLAPQTAWPSLYERTSTLKAFLHMFYPSTTNKNGATDAQLKALMAVLKKQGIKVGVEVGVARWGAGRCDSKAALAYAASEQQTVLRWVKLGGEIASVTSDHASVWNIRGNNGPSCVPAVPMAQRVDIVAQVWASWRKALPTTSFGFIVSLGFWDIEFGGTNFTCTDPIHLYNITGWIPRLDDFTAALVAAAKKHNPAPTLPLLDHYQIDFGMGGVEDDTAKYGTSEPAGVNYGRVLGAEVVMKKHGLMSGIILNAFHDPSHNCLVGCGLPPSHSAAVRTSNYTKGYLLQTQRLSKYAVLEQWQPFPNITGPETAKYSSMWMAKECAKAIKTDDSLVADATTSTWDWSRTHTWMEFNIRNGVMSPARANFAADHYDMIGIGGTFDGGPQSGEVTQAAAAKQLKQLNSKMLK